METKSCLKTETTVAYGTKKFQFSMPSSRVSRSEQINDTVQLAGFQGRVQREYNTCPVGCYAGPYDQNEKLKLSVQLPMSKLDYKSYCSAWLRLKLNTKIGLYTTTTHHQELF